MSIPYCDEIGPHKVLELYYPEEKLKAIVVVDNVAIGPAIGGVRVSPTANADEVCRLARAMTFKNAMAGLPHGGGKSAIVADPKDPNKERYFRIFARSIAGLTEYIPGPDMGSNEVCMAYIHDEIGRSVGLPEEIGGIPLDKRGATGFGLAVCAEVAKDFIGLNLKGARVAIQGFGSVGKAAAKFLSEKGAILIAVSDTKGAVYNEKEIDVDELVKIKDETGSVINYKKGEKLSCENLFCVPTDILIPAATPDVIHEDNVKEIQTKLILEGANIPATREAEEALHNRGILVIPDFVANAGGVIMAAAEYAKGTDRMAFDSIEEKIRKNTKALLERVKKDGLFPRAEAEIIAKERVLRAMDYRGYI
ncbi:MAG TPA: Glu/Leu/Phe/Val dehydrogenase [Nitrospiraceae bacterium]|nr:Glu/Leu/Phe/Val dehydrogenase [Nitrospiraceae bacterium]